MRVILTEKVPSLGNVGEAFNVSQGYARNFLIPRGLAVIASEGTKKQLENEKKRLAKKMEEAKKAATDLKAKIDKVSLTLIKKVGKDGKLFGTVTNTELAKELAALNIEIERRLLVLDAPIKNTGDYKVKAKLFTGVEASFKVSVQMDPVQAEEIKQAQAAAAKKASKKKEAAEAGLEAEQNSEELTEESTEE